MLINWFTVVAQIINFLILVWLLKRFLYKPVLKAIDEREKKIASQLEQAENKEKEAKKEQEEFKHKNDEFNKQQDILMNKAREEVKSERQQLLEEARKEADTLREKLEKEIKEEQQRLSNEIFRRTKKEVFAISKKTLKGLANKTLEEQIVQVFINQLKNTTQEKKAAFIAAFKGSPDPLVVRSVFELTAPQREEIKNTAKQMLEISSPFKFETAPELIGGIEMNVKGYKIEWSISNYLSSIEKTIAETINSKTEKKETIKNAGT